MMTVMEWAKTLLLSPHYSDKLLSITLTAPMGEWQAFALPSRPGREDKLQFSDRQIKFPKRGSLVNPQSRGIAIHSFANHELLAIEMMAAALLVYPHHDEDSIRMKRGIVAAIRDEQKHLALYVQRLKALGVQFGDYALNDFFWRQMEKLKTPSSFFALMALTFESANLDFAFEYEKIFRSVGDIETADVLKTVFEDEISHVALGAHWLGQWKGQLDLWDYYRSVLPMPLTPARAKGANYLPETRLAAGLEPQWVEKLGEFQDDFRITNRKAWKEHAES
jgi:uncharacterized ferritin-like protein (DUF455 family)